MENANTMRQLSLADTNEEYEAFVEKFKPKLTTDDCYTPALVYDAVADWVANEYGLNRANFVRPFWPGGDFERYPYKPTDVVVDNPPFSILARIIKFYNANGIRFFLFCQGMTAMSTSVFNGACAVCAGAQIIYENGANVNTSFATNMEGDTVARSAPELTRMVEAASERERAAKVKHLPKYEYPAEVLTSCKLHRMSKYGVDLRIKKSECLPIRKIDANGKGIYGAGLLLSERATAKRAAAERAAAERAAGEPAAATKWQLSERERALVKSLGE